MKRAAPLIVSALVAGLLLAGCHEGKLPDPNDPSMGPVSIQVLRGDLSQISDTLLTREFNGEITQDQYKSMMKEAAASFASKISPQDIDDSEAWEYGELFISAEDWQQAEPMLQAAVKYAKRLKNEDRRINDTLRLARVEAMLGKVGEAITLAQSTLDAKPVDSAPILPAIFYEIAPICQNKGFDVQLAQLLDAAVDKHLLTVVNSQTVSGRSFVQVRAVHARNAYELAAKLYDQAGKPDLAAKDRQRAEQTRNDVATLVREAQARQAGTTPSVKV